MANFPNKIKKRKTMNLNDKKLINNLSDKYSIKEILNELVNTSLLKAGECSDSGLKEKAIALTKISLTLEEAKDSLADSL